MNISEVIAAGDFTEFELDMFIRGKITFLVDRTSFSIEGIDVYREEPVPDSSQIFIAAVYLQNNTMRLGNKRNIFNLFDFFYNSSFWECFKLKENNFFMIIEQVSIYKYSFVREKINI